MELVVLRLANQTGVRSISLTNNKKGAEWADAHPKNQWISVKDKLPEPEQEVFLYDRDSAKHYAIGWLRKKKGYCKSKWFVTNGYVTDESITHWMPIPKFNV